MAIEGITPSTAALRAAMSSLPSLATEAPASGASGFGDMVSGAIEHLDDLHGTADDLAIDAATGTLSDVHEYTIAATEAEVATQLTVAVRDKAVEAFNEIMRMQV